MTYVLLAFVSGVVIEALYALGVLFISKRRWSVAGLLGSCWGAAFLLGLNESFKNLYAAAAWCVGLGIGTVIGIKVGGRT